MQDYLNKAIKTLSVSKKMWKEFSKELDDETVEKGTHLLDSSLYYEMIINHDYASRFEFKYSLIDVKI